MNNMINRENRDREDLIDNLTSLVGNGKGVEIGVFRGEFSKIILSKWEGTLYMVDVWRGLGDEYEDMSNHNNHSDAYLNTMKSIEGYEAKDGNGYCLWGGLWKQDDGRFFTPITNHRGRL